MDIQEQWNGIHKGDPVRVVRNVYQRQDGSPYGGIYYELPGHLLVHRGTVGRFSGKTDKGVLIYINNGANSILGLVLDAFAIEKVEQRKHL